MSAPDMADGRTAAAPRAAAQGAGLNTPRRPDTVVGAAYVLSGAATLWVVAAIATLFAIPQYSRYYGDLRQDASAASFVTLILVFTAVTTVVAAGVCILLAWLDTHGLGVARALTLIYIGLSALTAVVVLPLGVFDIAWHAWFMRAIAVLTLLSLGGSAWLLTRPSSAQFFRDRRTARDEELTRKRAAYQQQQTAQQQYLQQQAAQRDQQAVQQHELAMRQYHQQLAAYQQQNPALPPREPLSQEQLPRDGAT